MAITIEQTDDFVNNRQYRPDIDMEFGQAGEDAVGQYFVRKFGRANVVHWPFGKFDVDFVVRVNGVERFVDVETRHFGWPTGDWPFGSVHVPSRKWEMIGRRTPFYYFVVRQGLERALIIKGSDILAAHFEQVKGEDFFDVPASQIMQYIDLTGVE